MRSSSRFAAPVSLVVAIALAVAGCGTNAAPTTTAGVSPPTIAASASPDPATLAAFSEAMCPIFQAIVAIDPRISDLRQAAGDGQDLSAAGAEMTAVSDALLEILNDLEALPEWGPGAALRYELIVALHEIRATLLRAGRDPSSARSQAEVAGMPFIADDSLDRAMRTASDAGLSCGAPS